MTKPIIFIGFRGDLGGLREMADLMGRPVLGIMDENFPDVQEIQGIKNLGSERTLLDSNKHLLDECDFYVSSFHNGMQNRDNPEKTGSIVRAERIAFMESLDANFVTLYHPSRSWIDPTAEIGPGCFLGTNTSVGAYVKLGAHSVLSYSVGIGHHSVIGKNMIAMPRTLIGGSTVVGENCLFGINSSIMPGHWGEPITIGDNVLTHPGVIVMRSIPSNSTVTIYGKVMPYSGAAPDRDIIAGYSGTVSGRR